MNMKVLASSCAAVLALAACQTNGGSMSSYHNGHVHAMPAGHAHHGMSGHAAVSEQKFGCRTGQTVTVKHLGNDRIAVSLDTDTNANAVLTQARAASGELYVADNGLYQKRTEWHQKGGEAAFTFADPYGNVVETVCSR